MEILKWLDESAIVEEYKILEYKTFQTGFYIKIKVSIKNRTELFIREYSDLTERNYSYHWQNENGDLITRWDNSNHYPHLFNAPHHKHESNNIEPSNEMTISDVLKMIITRQEIV